MFGVLQAALSAPGSRLRDAPYAGRGIGRSGCLYGRRLLAERHVLAKSAATSERRSGAATLPGPGGVKVAMILPLSASGNAGLAAQSMKNAGEMALAEFNASNIQLLVKDDGGTAPGAQQARASRRWKKARRSFSGRSSPIQSGRSVRSRNRAAYR